MSERKNYGHSTFRYFSGKSHKIYQKDFLALLPWWSLGSVCSFVFTPRTSFMRLFFIIIGTDTCNSRHFLREEQEHSYGIRGWDTAPGALGEFMLIWEAGTSPRMVSLCFHPGYSSLAEVRRLWGVWHSERQREDSTRTCSLPSTVQSLLRHPLPALGSNRFLPGHEQLPRNIPGTTHTSAETWLWSFSF